MLWFKEKKQLTFSLTWIYKKSFAIIFKYLSSRDHLEQMYANTFKNNKNMKRVSIVVFAQDKWRHVVVNRTGTENKRRNWTNMQNQTMVQWNITQKTKYLATRTPNKKPM